MKLDQLPKARKDGRPLELENAVIKSVSLSIADHGCLTGWLHVEFAHGGCGFGGYMLGSAYGGNLNGCKNYAAEFIVRCLLTIGVHTWEGLSGESIRVLHEGLGGGIVAIGNFMKDEWFCPRIEFAEPIPKGH